MTDIKEAINYYATLYESYGEDHQVSCKINRRNKILYRVRRNMAKIALDALLIVEKQGCPHCYSGTPVFGEVLWAVNTDGKAVVNIRGEQAVTTFDCCPKCGRTLVQRDD